MKTKNNPKEQKSVPKKVKFNDWTCKLCQNYNYSFRVLCTYVFIQVIDATPNTATSTSTQSSSTTNKPADTLPSNLGMTSPAPSSWASPRKKPPMPIMTAFGTTFKTSDGSASSSTEPPNSHFHAFSRVRSIINIIIKTHHSHLIAETPKATLLVHRLPLSSSN